MVRNSETMIQSGRADPEKIEVAGLSSDEIALVEKFRMMDRRARREILAVAGILALISMNPSEADDEGK